MFVSVDDRYLHLVRIDFIGRCGLSMWLRERAEPLESWLLRHEAFLLLSSSELLNLLLTGFPDFRVSFGSELLFDLLVDWEVERARWHKPAHGALPAEAETRHCATMTECVLAGQLGRFDDKHHADSTVLTNLNMHLLYVSHLRFLCGHTLPIVLNGKGFSNPYIVDPN